MKTGSFTKPFNPRPRFNVVEIRIISLLSGAFLNHIGTLVKYKRNLYVPSMLVWRLFPGRPFRISTTLGRNP
jgi:hypothetical protein